MLVCNYCGRNLKNDYETCPGCGSHSFKKIDMIEQYAINKPPEDGYKIKIESYEKSLKMAKIVKWIGIGLLFFISLFEIPFLLGGFMTINEDVGFGASFIAISLCTTIPFFAVGIGLIVGSIKSKKKAKNNIERVNKLAKTGVLIKNIPYELKPTGTIINGEKIYYIQVLYESKSGKKIPLNSEPKYNTILGDNDGTADLLIDPNDISNYYIDFEIY